jgi:hypothetical protein
VNHALVINEARYRYTQENPAHLLRKVVVRLVYGALARPVDEEE